MKPGAPANIKAVPLSSQANVSWDVVQDASERYIIVGAAKQGVFDHGKVFIFR
ncbi:MAG: hypothetical protein WC956_10600 [bacterium]